MAKTKKRSCHTRRRRHKSKDTGRTRTHRGGGLSWWSYFKPKDLVEKNKINVENPEFEKNQVDTIDLANPQLEYDYVEMRDSFNENDPYENEAYKKYKDDFVKCQHASVLSRWSRTGDCKGNASRYLLSTQDRDKLMGDMKSRIAEKIKRQSHKNPYLAMQKVFDSKYQTTTSSSSEKQKKNLAIMFLTNQDKEELEKYAVKTARWSGKMTPKRHKNHFSFLSFGSKHQHSDTSNKTASTKSHEEDDVSHDVSHDVSDKNRESQYSEASFINDLPNDNRYFYDVDTIYVGGKKHKKGKKNNRRTRKNR